MLGKFDKKRNKGTLNMNYPDKKIELSSSETTIAQHAAKDCGNFIFDDEDEIIDDSVSCINCAFRRWDRDSYTCMNKN